MTDFNDIAIGNTVELENGRIGTVKDIYMKGDTIFAQITLLTSEEVVMGVLVTSLTAVSYGE